MTTIDQIIYNKVFLGICSKFICSDAFFMLKKRGNYPVWSLCPFRKSTNGHFDHTIYTKENGQEVIGTMGVNELDYKMIGQRIRAERNKKGWQQAELAFRAGMTSAHVSHIETAQTKLALPTIVKIANALSVSVDDLLYDSMEQVKVVYDKKIAEELEDCDPTELQAFLEIIQSTKKVLRTNRKVTMTY